MSNPEEQTTSRKTITVGKEPDAAAKSARPKIALKPGQQPRIIVRGVNWVGDAIMSTPALAHLRASFPDAHITLLARPWVAAIYERNPHINELWIEDDTASMGAFWKVVGRVRRAGFHIGVIFPNAFRSALMMKMAGVGFRIGYNRAQRWPLLSHAVPVDDELLHMHQVYYYLHLVETLSGHKSGLPKMGMYPGEVEREEMKRLLAQLGLDRGQPLVGIAPGSINSNAKRWLPERFAELADQLGRSAGAEILLLGSSAEQDVLDRVASLCTKKVHNLGGKVSLGQLIALMEKLQGLICNDAGAMHLAAALHIPTVAIFGPTDYTTTYPFSNVARIVREDLDCSPCMLRECPIKGHPCMTNIGIDKIAAAFKEVIKASRLPANTPPQPWVG